MSGLLGALSDPQFRADVGQGLLGALNRGAVGGLLGGPVDIATMAMRPLGYRVEKPVGGSEWIGDQMERMGIVGPQRNAVAETLASVAGPAAMMRAAPAVFAAEQAIPKAVEKYGMAAERAIAPAVTRGLERGGLTREMLLAMGNNTRSNMALMNVDGLPNRGKDEIQGAAERLGELLRAKGYQPTIDHSGSAAGPSSYLRAYDPTTGRVVLQDLRFSGHSKGPWESQFVRNVDPSEFDALIKQADEVRALGPSSGMLAEQARNAKWAQQEAARTAAALQRALAKVEAGEQLSRSESRAYTAYLQENKR